MIAFDGLHGPSGGRAWSRTRWEPHHPGVNAFGPHVGPEGWGALQRANELLSARCSAGLVQAQAQAEATKEAQKAGIKAAKEADDSATRYRGRKPTLNLERLHRTTELLSMTCTPYAISAELGIPRATVCHIKEDPAKAVALLQGWGSREPRRYGYSLVERQGSCGTAMWTAASGLMCMCRA